MICDADLRQPIDVGLARPEIAAFDRVVEQAIDAVAVVPIVLGRVDAALRRDAVRPPRRVLEAEALHVVAELAQRRRGRRSGQSAPDHDDVYFRLFAGIHQLHLEAVRVPLLLDRAGRHLGFELQRIAHLTTPAQHRDGNHGGEARRDTSTAITSARLPPERAGRGRAHAKAAALLQIP